MAKIKKRVQCYFCGRKGTKTYDTLKHKWTTKYKCPKCGSSSFRWYN